MGRKPGAGYRPRAQAREVRGLLLAVDHGHPELLQMRHEPHQRDLRGIALVREHGFAEEDAPQRQSVKAAHELAVAPALHRMRVALAMQQAIGIDHLGRDPRSPCPSRGVVAQAWMTSRKAVSIRVSKRPDCARLRSERVTRTSST